MRLEGKTFSHYRLLRLIGKGGMGEVYLAEDTQVERQVAVKAMWIEGEPGEQQIRSNAFRLFWREAKAVARLDHPGILPLYDHGEIFLDELHLAYLIMPYRQEGSLAHWIHQREQHQSLMLKQIASVIQQASQALQYAHDHHVMHLDIKPENFLLRNRSANDDYPDLFLCDFGIARLANATPSSSLHASGTPVYMAPEQWAGHPTFASDQYALAIMAYKLLTGNPPFQGIPMHVMYAHLQTPPPSVHQQNSLLPPALDPVLQQGLAKQPEDRFPSILGFAQAFGKALQNGEEAPPVYELYPPPSMPEPPSPALEDLTHDTSPQSARILPITPFIEADQKRTIPPHTSFPENRHVQFDASDPSPIVPGARKRERLHLPTRVIFVIILILFFLGPGSFVSYQVVTGIRTGQATATALATRRAGQTTATTIAATGKVWHSQQAVHLPQSPNVGFLSMTAWGNQQWVAVGSGGTIVTSADGGTWSPQPSHTAADLLYVAWGNQQWVAAGSGGTIVTSADGRTWSPQVSHTTAGIYSVAWGNQQWVAAGSGGVIVTSADGGTWSPQVSHTTADLWDVAWGNQQWVAAGSGGVIVTSADGGTWGPQASHTTASLRYVAWGNQQWVAAGSGGVIVTSADGGTWSPQASHTTAALRNVAWGNQQWVAAGSGGVIVTSIDGRAWTIRKSNTLDNLLGIGWNGSQWLIIGTHSTILTFP